MAQGNGCTGRRNTVTLPCAVNRQSCCKIRVRCCPRPLAHTQKSQTRFTGSLTKCAPGRSWNCSRGENVAALSVTETKLRGPRSVAVCFYGDESESHDPHVFTLAGFIATPSAWSAFVPAWR